MVSLLMLTVIPVSPRISVTPDVMYTIVQKISHGLYNLRFSTISSDFCLAIQHVEGFSSNINTSNLLLSTNHLHGIRSGLALILHVSHATGTLSTYRMQRACSEGWWDPHLDPLRKERDVGVPIRRFVLISNGNVFRWNEVYGHGPVQIERMTAGVTCEIIHGWTR
jgi:hypothetical protein